MLKLVKKSVSNCLTSGALISKSICSDGVSFPNVVHTVSCWPVLSIVKVEYGVVLRKNILDISSWTGFESLHILSSVRNKLEYLDFLPFFKKSLKNTDCLDIWLTIKSRSTSCFSPIFLISSHVPNLGSISKYVSGANPLSPDDGNGGSMWIPPLNVFGKYVVSTWLSVFKSPPRESG